MGVCVKTRTNWVWNARIHPKDGTVNPPKRMLRNPPEGLSILYSTFNRLSQRTVLATLVLSLLK
jgi:hypothetical protein